MSALPLKADIHGGGRNVRFVPIATDAPQQNVFLFDHLVTVGSPIEALQIWRSLRNVLGFLFYSFRLPDSHHDRPGTQHDPDESSGIGSGHQIHAPIRVVD